MDSECYATGMYFNHGGWHYSLAKELIKKGYVPTVVCANVPILFQCVKDSKPIDSTRCNHWFICTSTYMRFGNKKAKDIIARVLLK